MERALYVFWKKGYEGASLADLTEAMEINRSSLYTAFGSKERLFHNVLRNNGQTIEKQNGFAGIDINVIPGPVGVVLGAIATVAVLTISWAESYSDGSLDIWSPDLFRSTDIINIEN